MQRIKDWVAKRSGATITITGTTLDGAGISAAGVTSIEATDAGVIAYFGTDARFLLIPVGVNCADLGVAA